MLDWVLNANLIWFYFILILFFQAHDEIILLKLKLFPVF